MTEIAIALLSGATLGRLTSTDLGAYLSPAGSAYDASGPLSRLLVAAHDQPDLCGIDMEGATLLWSGGYTYLARTVPIFAAGGPGRANYHYVVVDKDHLAANPLPAEAYLVKRDHDWSLFRSSASCRLTASPNSVVWTGGGGGPSGTLCAIWQEPGPAGHGRSWWMRDRCRARTASAALAATCAA